MASIAVIGLGAWGTCHLSTLVGMLGPREVVGVDPDPHRREAAASRGIRVFADVDELPRGVRHAVVVTPVERHADVSAVLLEQGRHVLVEKPIATTVRDAERLIERATARGLVLMVGHVFLYQEAHEALRRAIAGLGKLRLLAIERRTPGYLKVGSGAWLELSPHELATALDLGALNAPVVEAVFLPWSVTGIGREDGASVRLRTVDSTVEISCSWLSAVRSRRVWAVADGGQALLVDSGGVPKLAVWKGPLAWERERPRPPVWRPVPGLPPLQRELHDFLEAASSGGPTRSPASLGLKVLELLREVEGRCAA